MLSVEGVKTSFLEILSLLQLCEKANFHIQDVLVPHLTI